VWCGVVREGVLERGCVSGVPVFVEPAVRTDRRHGRIGSREDASHCNDMGQLEGSQKLECRARRASW